MRRCSKPLSRGVFGWAKHDLERPQQVMLHSHDSALTIDTGVLGRARGKQQSFRLTRNSVGKC